MMMSVSSKRCSGLTVTNELFQELLIKYDTLQQNFKVLSLENKEYKKDIEELKEQNAQLTIDINTHKEIAQIERYKSPKSYLLSQLSSIDDMHYDNLDLNAQLKEYKNCVKQLKSENIQLKNENEKYKLALENANEFKQKREEIFANSKSILQNKNKELQQEIDALNHEISCIFTFRKRKSSTHSKYFSAGFDTPTSPKSPTLCIRSVHEMSCERLSSLRSNGTATKLATGFSSEPATLTVIHSQNVYEDDEFCTHNSVHLDDEHKELLPNKTSLRLGLTQSATLECDKDALIAIDESEELSQLREIKDDQDELIKGLKKEIKLLRMENGELVRKLNDSFKCSFLSMFK